MRNKSPKDNRGMLPINCYSAKPTDPKPVDFANLSLTSISNEEAPRPATALFQQGAFLVIKSCYQPTSLPEAPFYLGRCKDAVIQSVRKLAVTIFAQNTLIPSRIPCNFINAELRCQIEVTGILREANNILVKDDFVAVDEDEYQSAIIDCTDYGNQRNTQECQDATGEK